MRSSTEDSKLQESAGKYLCFSRLKEVMNTVYQVFARKTVFFHQSPSIKFTKAQRLDMLLG
jgi:hypothetical protein